MYVCTWTYQWVDAEYLYMPHTTYLYIVSASTSANQTLRSGVKLSPEISSMVRSPPMFSLRPLTTGMGVTGTETGPMPS